MVEVTIPAELVQQAGTMAEQRGISRSELLILALQEFIARESGEEAASSSHAQAVINQGDIFWVQLADPGGVEPGIPHPHVVIQDDVINHSRVDTVVVCALTSVLKRASLPGNVLLDEGEAKLPKQSVVEVSKVSSINKTLLGTYIGSLSEQRVKQILAGMRFLQTSFFAR